MLKSTHTQVPPPPANYTPAPSPPPSSYIELPADTTCVRQGIAEVPEHLCKRACTILGLTYTGSKPRPNATGCFALTSGEWKGARPRTASDPADDGAARMQRTHMAA